MDSNAAAPALVVPPCPAICHAQVRRREATDPSGSLQIHQAFRLAVLDPDLPAECNPADPSLAGLVALHRTAGLAIPSVLAEEEAVLVRWLPGPKTRACSGTNTGG